MPYLVHVLGEAFVLVEDFLLEGGELWWGEETARALFHVDKEEGRVKLDWG